MIKLVMFIILTNYQIKVKYMKILTVENKPFYINAIEDGIEEIYYGILDYSDKDNVDYRFIPLLFLEIFISLSLDLKIGKNRLQMPMDWSVVIGDTSSGELEVIELKKLNDRLFQVFGFNPIEGFMPEFLDIEIINVFPDVKWYVPKLKYGHLLTVPLENKEKPTCSYFVRDWIRIPEVLDIGQ